MAVEIIKTPDGKTGFKVGSGAIYQVEDVKAKTVIQHPDGGKTEHEEVLEQVVSTKPLANIGMKLGKTTGLPNYSSLKVEVSLHYPSPVDQLDETFEIVKAWLDNKMGSVLDELEGIIGPTAN